MIHYVGYEHNPFINGIPPINSLRKKITTVLANVLYLG